MKTFPAFNCAPPLRWGGVAVFAIWLGFPNDLWAFPPAVLLWPVSLVGLALVSSSPWQALTRGWLASACGMISVLYWLSMPVAQVGGLPWPLAFLCAMFISACLAAQGGLFCALARGLANYGFWLLAPLLALAWYLLELAFAFALGFPWLPLAGALVQWPLLIQASSVFGAYFTGAIWLFGALLCLNPVFAKVSRNSRILAFAAGCLLISVLIWHGACKISNSELVAQNNAGKLADVVMVEGNVDQNQKWTPPFQRHSLELYIRLTDAALTAARAAGMERPLIIWPETAMPFFYERNAWFAGNLRDAVMSWRCPLLFGAPGVSSSEEYVYNRAFLLGPGGETIGQYDKVHLVPFGEYLPAWLSLPFLEALLQGVGIYQEGTSLKSLPYGPLALGVLICYESIFPWLARDRITGGANILVDISNDGWFGRTPAARQHLCLTVLRCVEENRWLWRATNTGISAVADNHGRILFSGPVFKEGFLLCRGLLISGRSAYYYLSVWLPWLSLAMFCGLVGAGRRGVNVRQGNNAEFK